MIPKMHCVESKDISVNARDYCMLMYSTLYEQNKRQKISERS